MKRMTGLIVVLYILFCLSAAYGEERQIGLIRAEQTGNIRQTTAGSARIVGKMREKEFYPCFEKTDGWYLVCDPNGVKGYVSERLCTFYSIPDPLNQDNDLFKDDQYQELETGDIVHFGHFEQNNNASDGAEPIEWIVLNVNKTEKKMLLISRYGIDCQHYHLSNNPVVWENSGLRKWLNDTFRQTAFEKKERDRILPSYLKADPNPEYNVKCGGDTTDYVFLLSIAEVQRYMKAEFLPCRPTIYTIVHNGSYDFNTGCSWWWLRTAGHDRMHTSYVNDDGEISAYGYGVISNRGVVRPAIWISIAD